MANKISKFSQRSRRKSSALMAGKNRICVDRSNLHFGLKVVAPNGNVLVECSTRQKAIKSDLAYTGNKDAAYAVGVKMGEKIAAMKLENLAFDRAGLLYTGRVQAAAEGLRSVKVNI